ncbi:protein of unknown function [Methylocella tundrae]|uniref:Uncharacterized protein n=1 Tax=Methylocella tundrae TaxID=227605 RepID=A0A4U8YW44_METTU|nr:protein of unknown function [Methylocella tundrae]
MSERRSKTNSVDEIIQNLRNFYLSSIRTLVFIIYRRYRSGALALKRSRQCCIGFEVLSSSSGPRRRQNGWLLSFSI